MKYMTQFVFALLFCVAHLFGSIICDGPASDGFLRTGEYDDTIVVNSNSSLNVNGGASDRITVEDSAKLIISITSSLSNQPKNRGGVWTIILRDESNLTFSGGATNKIYTGGNSTTILTGGQINSIASQQRITNGTHIEIYCNEGWLWKYNSYSEIKGIIGNWRDGTPFDIAFIDDSSNYFPATWKNIEVITPEPASMLLLSLGGVLIKKRRRQ